MKTVFVVDDSDTNLTMAEEALDDIYQVMTIPSAAVMFKLIEKITPDLILLDIEMPGMNGFDAIKILKADDRYIHIPVVFLTSRTDPEVETQGLNLGAADYITKPFSRAVLRQRVKVHLDVGQLVSEQTARLRKLQSGIVFVLADIVENRDRITGGHIERTTGYLTILMESMRGEGVYKEELSQWDLELTASSARLHDVGKITISDTILNKPARLTDEEYEIIKSHVPAGVRVINQMVDHTGEEAFLHHAMMFAGMHHEHWDGTGYPNKLKGMDIPLEGRIMAIADVYDALVSERPYKKPFTHEEAVAIISADSDRHFDPSIVNVFMKVQDKFKYVYEKLNSK